MKLKQHNPGLTFEQSIEKDIQDFRNSGFDKNWCPQTLTPQDVLEMSADDILRRQFWLVASPCDGTIVIGHRNLINYSFVKGCSVGINVIDLTLEQADAFGVSENDYNCFISDYTDCLWQKQVGEKTYDDFLNQVKEYGTGLKKPQNSSK